MQEPQNLQRVEQDGEYIEYIETRIWDPCKGPMDPTCRGYVALGPASNTHAGSVLGEKLVLGVGVGGSQ